MVLGDVGSGASRLDVKNAIQPSLDANEALSGAAGHDGGEGGPGEAAPLLLP